MKSTFMQSYEPVSLLVLNYIAQKAWNYFCWLSGFKLANCQFFFKMHIIGVEGTFMQESDPVSLLVLIYLACKV